MNRIALVLVALIMVAGCASAGHNHKPVNDVPFINSMQYIGSGVYDVDFNAIELKKKLSGATAGMVGGGGIGVSESHWDDILHEIKPFVLQWGSTHGVKITTIRALLDGSFKWEIYNN